LHHCIFFVEQFISSTQNVEPPHIHPFHPSFSIWHTYPTHIYKQKRQSRNPDKTHYLRSKIMLTSSSFFDSELQLLRG
jgi:hypothetical protein